MNLDLLRQTLIEAARRNKPSDAVPPAFERRVMARVLARSRPDPLLTWYAGLRRAALSACGIAAVLGIVNYATPGATAEDADLPELAPTCLESAVFAPAVATVDSW